MHPSNTLMSFISTLAYSIVVLTASTLHAEVMFDWATVGNPGNVDDTIGYGGVDYIYRMSKYEITNAQYTEFLNAVAATDTNRLYNTLMGSASLGGITRSGSSGSYTYSVKPTAIGQGPGGTDGDDYTYANKPVVYVSFLDAMRFVNWLQNGQPTGTQGPGTTENGVYTISDGLSEVRDPGATYFIPRQDEWFKAAYYDPSGTYYDYATSTDIRPNNNLPSSDTGNSANFYDDGYTTGNESYPMTDVGAYTLSASPYGTFDQAGNVWEYNEESFFNWRKVAGGGWYRSSTSFDDLAADHFWRFNSTPDNEDHFRGFRVASVVPEPGVNCDFNVDGECDIGDLNALLMLGPLAPGIPAAGQEAFDLTGDGVIDNVDVDQWLAAAATENGLVSPYFRGDANLDGFVDASDFNIWNSHRLSFSLAWDSGDFNGDGAVDASDFNVWNSHRLMSSAGAPAAVPEPESLWLLFIAGGWLAAHRRRG